MLFCASDAKIKLYDKHTVTFTGCLAYLGLQRNGEVEPMSMYNNEQVHELFQNAHGPIPYNLMNDYMFRVVLQANEFGLRGLIGAIGRNGH